MDQQPKRKPGRPRIHPAKDPNRPKYVKGVPRPQAWIHKDPLMHEMNMPFLRARAQCKFRNEPFELTFDDWYAIWRDHWHLRGRGIDDYCLVRIDDSLPWSVNNCQIQQRREQLRRYFNPHTK